MLSADERKALSEWVALSDQNRRHFQRQCELWASSGAAAELDRFDAEAAYRRFVRNVEADILLASFPVFFYNFCIMKHIVFTFLAFVFALVAVAQDNMRPLTTFVSDLSLCASRL